jgi:hypothetical protein
MLSRDHRSVRLSGGLFGDPQQGGRLGREPADGAPSAAALPGGKTAPREFSLFLKDLEAHQRGPFGLMRFDYFRAPILGHGLNPVAALAMRSDPKGLHDGSMAQTVMLRKGNLCGAGHRCPGTIAIRITHGPAQRAHPAIGRDQGGATVPRAAPHTARRFPRFRRRDSIMQGARPSHQCGDSR